MTLDLHLVELGRFCSAFIVRISADACLKTLQTRRVSAKEFFPLGV